MYICNMEILCVHNMMTTYSISDISTEKEPALHTVHQVDDSVCAREHDAGTSEPGVAAAGSALRPHTAASLSVSLSKPIKLH